MALGNELYVVKPLASTHERLDVHTGIYMYKAESLSTHGTNKASQVRGIGIGGDEASDFHKA
jgi:hypothetical protein